MLGPEMMRQTSDVEAVVRLTRSSGTFATQNLTVDYRGIYAESEFMSIFNFPLKYGDSASALNRPYSVILTSEKAEELFGSVNPIGKTVEHEGMGPFEVTGVFGQLNPKTHLQFDAVLSLETLVAGEAAGTDYELSNWNRNTKFYNYVRLADGADPERLESIANLLGEEHHNSLTLAAPRYTLQRVTQVNLGKDLSNQIGAIFPAAAAIAFSIYAALLMLVAIINYITLSASRSLERAKEVGIRKVMGASRGQIIKQSVSEAVLLALIALGIAAVMFVWLADQYNNMLFVRRSSAMIEVADLGPVVWVMFILFAVIAGVLAGILPAINMSKHSPVRVLNGPISWTGGRRFTGRKILVVLQFSLSMVAIVMTSVLYNQTRYILAADYGFDQEQLVHVRLGNVSYETLKDELTKIPGIMEVAATSSVPAAGPTYNTTIQIPGEEDVSLIQQFSVDANFLSQYRLPVVI